MMASATSPAPQGASEEPEAEVLPRAEVQAVEIEAIPGRTRVLAGNVTHMHAVIRIRTPEPDEEATAKRPPFQVACVLDNSGSMSGQKLDYAKRAVLKLVKHLSARDTLHFVIYNSTSHVIFENGDLSEVGKQELRSKVNGVQAQGQTNLCDGLQTAVDLLSSGAAAPQPEEEDKPSDEGVKRIFLFSDGCVNRGVTDKQEIRRRVAAWAEKGITTSTFGIGVDFDEDLMRGIAESGQGRYKFLATSRDIPKIVSKSVHDLLDIFASEVILDLRGGMHTVVKRTYGSGDDLDEDGEPAAASGRLHLGDLHNSNERLVLADLEVAPPGQADGSGFVAAEWVLTCQRNGALAQFSGQVTLQATRSREELGEESVVVGTAFAIRRAADLDLEVAQCLTQRPANRQKARELKSKQEGLLKEALERATSAGRDAAGEAEMLGKVLERAQRVAAQLQDEHEDNEVVRRQCVQEMELGRAMSCASFGDRQDSSDSGGHGDVANLQDFDDSDIDSLPSSPRSQPRRSRTPPSRSLSPVSVSPRSSQCGVGARVERKGIFGAFRLPTWLRSQRSA